MPYARKHAVAHADLAAALHRRDDAAQPERCARERRREVRRVGERGLEHAPRPHARQRRAGHDEHGARREPEPGERRPGVRSGAPSSSTLAPSQAAHWTQSTHGAHGTSPGAVPAGGERPRGVRAARRVRRVPRPPRARPGGRSGAACPGGGSPRPGCRRGRRGLRGSAGPRDAVVPVAEHAAQVERDRQVRDRDERVWPRADQRTRDAHGSGRVLRGVLWRAPAVPFGMRVRRSGRARPG
jgi:hypothetical protein